MELIGEGSGVIKTWLTSPIKKDKEQRQWGKD